ncbi:MAG: hypothetical protein JSR59_20815 [Proteobacteria bacterium]|nr:hypothetical protein [Pseudomonadota bacterium]
MKRYFVGTLLFAAAILAGCGGGSSSSDDTGGGTAYAAAVSTSFSPTVAKDQATGAQDVPLHWVYAVNNGQPITVSVSGVSASLSVPSIEVKLAPTDLKRVATISGPVSGDVSGTSYSGNVALTVEDDLVQSNGTTASSREALGIDLSLSAGGESGTVQGNVTVDHLSPPYEWFLDRSDLDQLAVGYTTTISSSGVTNANIAITDASPIVVTNAPVTVTDRWTVVAKLDTLSVRGKAYTDVVQLTRETSLPDASGNLVPVTIQYWVAKGVGMVKGVGVYNILNSADVVYELTETNLTQD